MVTVAVRDGSETDRTKEASLLCLLLVLAVVNVRVLVVALSRLHTIRMKASKVILKDDWFTSKTFHSSTGNNGGF